MTFTIRCHIIVIKEIVYLKIKLSGINKLINSHQIFFDNVKKLNLEI